MSQKLPLGVFNWVENASEFSKDFIENYNEDSDEGHFLEADVQYLDKLQELHNDLPFLPERMKTEKAEKLVVNLHNEKKFVMYIRNLKQTLNHRLVLKKVQSH